MSLGVARAIQRKKSAPLTIPGEPAWQAAWYEVGGKRIYFRSLWEYNYACYLQWLLDRGEIAGWEYEKTTFWFEAIKRGGRSYKPDFLIRETNGSEVYHEVKGWMRPESRTAHKRMAKYHPTVRLIVIDAKAYANIKSKVGGIVPGWVNKNQPINPNGGNSAAGSQG